MKASKTIAAAPDPERARRAPVVPDYVLQFGIAVCLLAAVLLGGIAVVLLQAEAFAGGASPVPTDSAAPAATATAAATATPPPTAAPSPTLPPTATPDYGERVNRILRELDTVWAAGDWERAAQLCAEALAFRPGDPSLRQKMVAAYFNLGVHLLDDGEATRALRAFEQALEVQPGEPQVVLERTVLVNYLTGIGYYNERNWSAAAQSLAKVYASDAGYLDTRELLYRAYFNTGTALKEKKDLPGALKAFEAAVDVDNEVTEARAEAAQLRAALTPPTPKPPSATGEKWIDVNLKTQRMTVYQGQTVVYNWVVSTGEPKRPTIPGRFKILDKIPMARSNVWNLWMPNWMGIYWAGTVENGIHALPILSNGQLLWAGFLGRRISFGCVVLGTKESKQLFDWAQIGTPVIIHN